MRGGLCWEDLLSCYCCKAWLSLCCCYCYCFCCKAWLSFCYCCCCCKAWLSFCCYCCSLSSLSLCRLRLVCTSALMSTFCISSCRLPSLSYGGMIRICLIVAPNSCPWGVVELWISLDCCWSYPSPPPPPRFSSFDYWLEYIGLAIVRPFYSCKALRRGFITLTTISVAALVVVAAAAVVWHLPSLFGWFEEEAPHPIEGEGGGWEANQSLFVFEREAVWILTDWKFANLLRV